jgi:hypothetical protein
MPLNSTGTYHKKHKTTKKKYKPLNTIWSVISNYGLLYGGEDHMVRFGKVMRPQEYQYKEDELAFTEGKP